MLRKKDKGQVIFRDLYIYTLRRAVIAGIKITVIYYDI